ncbi:unnamed protein product [Somion occarium]|uniref:glutathione transferase n=1 Tax=Somion occarium TaxID=3059160 RepID=A0ABP1DMV7_9APHY
MTIHIHGFAASTCTRRVAVVVKELGVPYVVHSVNLATGEQKAPSFLEHQPFGQVPYIVDDANDNFELFESRAIARYLVHQYDANSGLIPKDIKKLAKFEQAASIETADFDPYASKIGWEKVFKQFRGLTADEAVVKQNLEILTAKLDAYDRILSKSKYLGGDELTLADLFHLPYGDILSNGGFADLFDNESKRPNVTRWWREIASRPAWQAVKNGV